MYFSRVRVSPQHLTHFSKLFQYNHYQLHQLLWRLFKDKPEKGRDFLFRQDMDNYGLPVFYVVSKYRPVNTEVSLIVEPKPYQPQLLEGDTLAFRLRANPIERVKQGRDELEQLRHEEQRKALGLKDKQTKKRIHHDVVMHLKKSMAEEERAFYSQAELEQQAGEKWLIQKSDQYGFRVLSVVAQGYQRHHFKQRRIKLSTLDFEGFLQVTDPEMFIDKALFKGIGPAKAFGCGLLSVARV